MDPRRSDGKSCAVNNWTDWNNVVWFFENVMNCEPKFKSIRVNGADSNSRTDRLARRQFIRMANDYHGGIDAVWKRLSVAPILNKFLVVPLAMKLAWETGLNATSILNLKRDCYIDCHPVTGRPFISYFKARSRGEKELHLDLLVSEDSRDSRLLPKQIEIIRNTVHLILKLTQPLVEKAEIEDKDCLLLVEAKNKHDRQTTSVSRIKKSTMGNWSRQVKINLKQQGIETLQHINLARFRPTRITELVSEGIDFFCVQAVSGHAKFSTTLNYLNNHNFIPFSQLKIATCIEQIYLNQE